MDKFNVFYKYSINFSIILIIITTVGGLIFNQGIQDFLFSLFIPILLLVIGFNFYKINKFNKDSTYLWKLTLVLFVIKLISIFAFSEILLSYNNIPFLSFKDDYLYYQSSVDIARGWKVYGFSIDEDIRLSTGFYSGYPNINALAIYLFGESTYVPKILNAVISGLIVIVCFKILKLYTSNKIAKLVTSIIAFSPILIYFSSFVLKDVMLLLFTLIAIYCFCNLLEGRVKLRRILYLILALTLMIFFRAATITPLVGAFILVYIYKSLSFKRGFSYYSLLFVIFSLIAFVYVWNYLASTGIVTDFESYFSPRYDSFFGKEIETSGSNISNLSVISYLGAPLFLLSSLFLPSHLFINFDNIETINYTSSALIYHFAILPFILFGFFWIFKNFKKVNISVLFIFLVLIFFKVGLSVSINGLFSTRQSLGSIYAMYFLLPIYFEQKIKIVTLKYYFFISIIIILLYNILRFAIR
ncbi:ArnT family glycosyltransferase [Aequorivita capsosiphonis]|uniref:ArnT family glycosyltransferase n=1 Tax=Aequorivita capsosiphonis TaxID=487317 RepID=UPI0004232B75|nr:glycosyltransferase family 39 protein [Aequorivita capsosiphonis]